jgi:hypothetical protein
MPGLKPSECGMVLVSSQAQNDLLKPLPAKVTWKDQVIRECQFDGLPLSEVIRFLRDEFHDVQLVIAGLVGKVLVDLMRKQWPRLRCNPLGRNSNSRFPDSPIPNVKNS